MFNELGVRVWRTYPMDLEFFGEVDLSRLDEPAPFLVAKPLGQICSGAG